MDNIDFDKATSTDVHSFYQEIFITDLEKKLIEKDEESSGLNKQIIENANCFERLQNEHLKAKKIIKLYRDMILNQKPNPIKTKNELGCDNSHSNLSISVNEANDSWTNSKIKGRSNDKGLIPPSPSQGTNINFTHLCFIHNICKLNY